MPLFLLLPPPLHRAALRIAHGLRRRWWRLRRPTIRGCRILALDDAGRVLLVRHSYGSPAWCIPAGGLGRGEDARAGACRELAEETGCELVEACLVEVVEEIVAGARNVVHVVAGTARGTLRPDGREIVEAGFFAPGDLPSPLAKALPAGVPRWLALHADARIP